MLSAAHRFRKRKNKGPVLSGPLKTNLSVIKLIKLEAVVFYVGGLAQGVLTAERAGTQHLHQTLFERLGILH